MAIRNTLTDYDRNPANFNQGRVDEILPEHVQEQYPMLVTLLEKYYDWLENEWADSDGRAPMQEFKDIVHIKDRESTPERFFEYMYNESVNGIAPDIFDLPRFTLKMLPFFYKTKGTLQSAQGFFRFVFGIDAIHEYPKNDIFIIGESEIGPESLKFIQDSYYYQVFSILVKSELPISQWGRIYKRYIHPAGFALFSEVLFESLIENIALDSIELNGNTLVEDGTGPTVKLIFDGFESSYYEN